MGNGAFSGVTSGLPCLGANPLDLHHGLASAGPSFW